MNPVQTVALRALIGPEMAALAEGSMTALGNSLSKEEQMFVSKNWKDVPKFLASKEGKEAAQMFVQIWEESLKQAKEKAA